MHPHNKCNRLLKKIKSDLDVEFAKVQPIHPRDRLQRKVKNNEIKFVKEQRSHPKDRMTKDFRWKLCRFDKHFSIQC